MLLQWALGAEWLWHRKKLIFPVIAVSTLYLSLADTLAIHLKIWTISGMFTTVIHLGKLPIEEGVFFLATNIMVVQGLELAWSLLDGFKIRLFKKRLV